jgi:Holliday junction resolvasome RuvABC endonuclease subunit
MDEKTSQNTNVSSHKTRLESLARDGGQAVTTSSDNRTKILALDLATKTGWAHSFHPLRKEGEHPTAGGVWDLSVRRDESGGMRLVRLAGKLRDIRDMVGLDLVVFEAARHAAPKMQGALVVQAELQGVVKSFCEMRDINYRGYSPSEIKKHATGKGNANKAAMIQAAKQRWSDVQIIDDNQADALWLLDLAIQEYGDVLVTQDPTGA